MLTPEQIAINVAAWGDFIAANAPPSWNDWLRGNFAPPYPDTS